MTIKLHRALLFFWRVPLILLISETSLAKESFCNDIYSIEEAAAVRDHYYHPEREGKLVKVSEKVRYEELIAPTYELVTETVIVQNASTELISIPATWGWVDGEHPGISADIILTPAQYETIEDYVVVREESTHILKRPIKHKFHGGKKYVIHAPQYIEVKIPAVKEKVSRKVIKELARYKMVKLKNVIRNGKTYKVVTPVVTKELPSYPIQYQVERRIIKTPLKRVARTLDEPLYKWIPNDLEAQADRFLLRHSDGQILKQFDTREALESFRSDLTCDEIAEHFSEND